MWGFSPKLTSWHCILYPVPRNLQESGQGHVTDQYRGWNEVFGRSLSRLLRARATIPTSPSVSIRQEVDPELEPLWMRNHLF